eukprot:6187770-Pleurochrysis_carterae.AAC.1
MSGAHRGKRHSREGVGWFGLVWVKGKCDWEAGLGGKIWEQRMGGRKRARARGRSARRGARGGREDILSSSDRERAFDVFGIDYV